MIKILCAILLVSNICIAAGNIETGKRKGVMCVGCHGEAGKSSNPLWPNLAGQQPQYLVKQLKDFKMGRRSDPLMTSIVAALSEQDIEDLSAYFHSIKN